MIKSSKSYISTKYPHLPHYIDGVMFALDAHFIFFVCSLYKFVFYIRLKYAMI